MKTKHLIMAMAALAIAGCSQNEITEKSPDANPAIGFSVYTGAQTKGAVTDNTAIQASNKGFGICAYLTGSSGYSTSGAKSLFMDNIQATYTSGTPGSWGYSPTKFWPTNTDKLSFFAYAPYSVGDGSDNGIKLVKATGTTDPLVTFALQTKQKEMVDLVVSESTNSNPNKTIDMTSSDATVAFKLKHVLTRINMKAKTSVDISSNADTKVFITKVEFIQSNKLNSTRDFNMKTGEWASSTTYLTSPYELKDAGNSTDEGILNMAAASFGGYTTNSIDISTDAAGISLFPADEYLFFIPIDKTTGTANAGDVQLKITYDIVTKTSNTTHAKSTTEKTIDLGTGAFKQGTAYLYTITVGLNDIKVSGTVEDWGTATPGNLS